MYKILIVTLYAVIFFLVFRFFKNRKIPYMKILGFVGLFVLFVLIVMVIFA